MKLKYILYKEAHWGGPNKLQSRHETCKAAMEAAPTMEWANLQPDLWCGFDATDNCWSIEREIEEVS